MKGVIAVQWNGGNTHSPADFDSLRESFARWEYRENYPWVSVVDDTQSICTDKRGIADFLWMTFTRSDPAQDLHGVSERFNDKHWAIDAPLIVDARIKAHHQKPLAIDEGIVRKAKKFLGNLGLALAVAVVGGFATGANAAGHCATARILEYQRNMSKMKVAARTETGPCGADVFYDSVYTRTTPHFQIFYTLDYGPHATTPEFVDSLAASLESAYTFHTKTMGMRAPQGLDTTSHFLKPVKNGLYPVEVAEIDFLRDPTYVLSASACNGCFGVTYPSKKDHSKSAIIIDNDFRYVPDNSTKMDTIRISGKDCPYPDASVPIYSKAYGFSYPILSN